MIRQDPPPRTRRTTTPGTADAPVVIDGADALRRIAARKALKDGFDRFAAIYPNWTAPEAAWREWRKLNPDPALVEDIIAAVLQQRHSRKWLKDGGAYVPNPAKWIADKQWLNGVRPVQTTALGAEPCTTWDAVLDRMAVELDRYSLHRWFGGSVELACDLSRVRLDVEVASPFHAEWIEKHYRAIVDACAEPYRVTFVGADERERVS